MLDRAAANGPNACCSYQMFEASSSSSTSKGSWLLAGMLRRHMEAASGPLTKGKGLVGGHLPVGVNATELLVSGLPLSTTDNG